jgi:superfamily I DNA/RNA helicase
METLYSEYRKALKKSDCLDFEDLPAGTARLFLSHKEILKQYQKKFSHIFVDEYQDINFSQYILIRLLTASLPGEDKAESSLWVIGDPNQAIYGFRGSDKRFIDRFLKDYPNAGCFELSKSFRCAGPIINAAGRLAGTRLTGTQHSEKAGEVCLYRTKYATEKAEAEGIARSIAALLGGTSFFAMDSADPAGTLSGREGLAPEDCAVLVRAAPLAAPIIKALKDHGIPFELSGEKPWWKEEPAAAILDILKKQNSGPASPGDLIKSAWGEIPGKHKMKGSDCVEKLMGLAGFFKDVPSLLDTLDSCAASGDHLFQVAGPERLMSGVRVMTIHASKGLEFEHVFAAGLEEGMLPFTLFDKDGQSAEKLEEERRLLYVAMTRAKQGLWLSWAESRIFRGRALKSGPSRFLSELEKIIPLAGSHKPLRNRDRQLSLF